MSVLINQNKKKIDITDYMPNNEWLIVDTLASNYSIIVPENQPWDITEYVINVKRKPTFQFYGFILPNTSEI
jgi:hypothetical protein